MDSRGSTAFRVLPIRAWPFSNYDGLSCRMGVRVGLELISTHRSFQLKRNISREAEKSLLDLSHHALSLAASAIVVPIESV